MISHDAALGHLVLDAIGRKLETPRSSDEIGERAHWHIDGMVDRAIAEELRTALPLIINVRRRSLAWLGTLCEANRHGSREVSVVSASTVSPSPSLLYTVCMRIHSYTRPPQAPRPAKTLPRATMSPCSCQFKRQRSAKLTPHVTAPTPTRPTTFQVRFSAMWSSVTSAQTRGSQRLGSGRGEAGGQLRAMPPKLNPAVSTLPTAPTAGRGWWRYKGAESK